LIAEPDPGSSGTIDPWMFSHENQQLHEFLMGVETPIPPKMITATAPDGARPRRIMVVEIIIYRYSWLGCEPDRFMHVSPDPGS